MSALHRKMKRNRFYFRKMIESWPIIDEVLGKQSRGELPFEPILFMPLISRKEKVFIAGIPFS